MNINLTQSEIERIRMLLHQALVVPESLETDIAIFNKMELHLLKLRQAAFDATEAITQYRDNLK